MAKSQKEPLGFVHKIFLKLDLCITGGLFASDRFESYPSGFNRGAIRLSKTPAGLTAAACGDRTPIFYAVSNRFFSSRSITACTDSATLYS